MIFRSCSFNILRKGILSNVWLYNFTQNKTINGFRRESNISGENNAHQFCHVAQSLVGTHQDG